MRKFAILLALLALLPVRLSAPHAGSIVVASAPPGEELWARAHILPLFTAATGITVHVLAQGTGQALATAARDDADLVLVHDPEAEQKFIAAGGGIDRRQNAWNDC